MPFIDQLLSVLETRQDLPLYHRAVLKTAISFLDQKGKRLYARDQNWRVRLTLEEMESLPGRYWEVVDGQPIAKIETVNQIHVSGTRTLIHAS